MPSAVPPPISPSTSSPLAPRLIVAAAEADLSGGVAALVTKGYIQEPGRRSCSPLWFQSTVPAPEGSSLKAPQPWLFLEEAGVRSPERRSASPIEIHCVSEPTS